MGVQRRQKHQPAAKQCRRASNFGYGKGMALTRIRSVSVCISCPSTKNSRTQNSLNQISGVGTRATTAAGTNFQETNQLSITSKKTTQVGSHAGRKSSA